MKTIQVQKEKVRKRTILKFEDTNPHWSKLVHKPKTETMEFYDKVRLLDLADFKSCIVGEAHGFNKDYINRGTKDYCGSCYHQAISFANILMEGPKAREDMVNKFVNHWNSSHA